MPTKPVWTEAQIITQQERNNWTWAHSPGSATVINYSYYSKVTAKDLSNSNADYDTFRPLTDGEKAAVEASHLAFSDATMITFNLVADDGSNTNKITYADTTIMPSGTWGWSSTSTSSGHPTASSIWINDVPGMSTDYSYGSYNLSAMTHESEHSMGIPHPGNYNAGDGSTYDSSAVYAQDSTQYTIMSYWDESKTGANFGSHVAQTLLRDDIAVLQALYGANMTTRTGDTVYGFNSTATGTVYDFSTNGANPVICIWDAGGNDTIDFSGYTAATRIDLNAGGFSSTPGMTYNVSIAVGATIENAVGGSGNDTIFAGAGVNSINGGGGDDLIVFDSTHNIDPSFPAYGTANDILTADDVVNGGAGNDTVELHGDYSAGLTLGAKISNIEKIVLDSGYSYNLTLADALIGAGKSLIIDASSLTSSDLLTINASAETNGNLIVIGGAGAVAMTGGSGSNTLVLGTGGNTYTGTGGSNTLSLANSSGAFYYLLGNLTSGTFSVGGSATTYSGITGLTGSNFGDTISLYPFQSGTLEGGLGNDTLTGATGTTVSYAGAPSAVTVDLYNGTASGGAGNDTLSSIANIIGSSYDDTFIGNSGNNTFNGGGGNDTVSYKGSGGVTVDLSISGAQSVGGGQGNDAFISIENIIGSDNADTITGDSGNNTIEGGFGNDTLDGGGGINTVSYAGATSAVVVNLATGTATGGANSDRLSNFQNIIGSADNDTLTGDAGNNTFFGDAGDDSINGGAGVDTVDYSAATAAIKVDLATSSAQTIGGGMGVDKLSNIEAVIGSAYNDDLRATSGTVSISGGAGDDKIYAWGYLTPSMVVDGGTGSDTLYLNGSNYSSGITLQATTIQNIENIYFYSGASYNVTENNGNVAAGATLSVLAYGATAGQSVRFDGSAEADGNFSFYAGAASDTFIGGAGNDSFSSSPAYLSLTDTYDGGAGSDTLWLSGGFASNYTFSANQIKNIESLNLTSGGDFNLTTNDGNLAAGQTMDVWNNNVTSGSTALFDGSAETDGAFAFHVYKGLGTFTGGAGNDTFDIVGTEGAFTLNGGGGADTFTLWSASASLVANGGAGDDIFNAKSYLRATMQFDGGTGSNSLNISGDYSGANALVFTNTTIQNIQGIWFGEQQDYSLTMADGNVAAGQTLDIYANNANSLIFNGAAETDGNFRIDGTSKSDTITGGGGNDWIDGLQDIFHSVGDVLNGGAGNDTVSYQHLYWYGANVDLTKQGAAQTICTNGSNIVSDTLSNFENIFGSYQNDTLIGDSGNNTIEGWVGNDVMDGGAGNDTAAYTMATSGVAVSLALATAQTVGGGMGIDTLTNFENLLGSAYNDTLTGDAGDNTLSGGLGNDVLDGDGGNDTAVFSGNRSAYTITQNGHGVYTISGTDGTDTLTNIENAKFADQMVSLDLIAPTLSSTSPADDATGVAVSANIVLTFSENVAAGTGNIVIHSADGTAVATISVTDSSQVTISGTTVTINPTADLAAGTGYYVTLAAGVIADTAGNTFAGITSATAFNFATAAAADITPPTLSSTSPADNATNVAPSANLVLTFSEAVKAGTGNIIIHRADGTALDTIAIGDATQVTISGSTVTINPTADLPDGAGYYVTIASGAITDLAGNAFAGISDTTAFNFTTADITPPTLSSTSPADNATGVAVDTNIVLTFSEAVKAGTGKIVFHSTLGNETIDITDTTQVTISGNTVTINPTGVGEPGTDYYVTIDSGAITDLTGNAFAGISDSTIFNFTTAAASDTTAPTLSSTSPADDATGVAVGANLVLTFSEAVKAGTGNFIVHSANGTAVATIAASDTSQVTISGSSVTVNPTADLLGHGNYYVTVDSGAITDLAGNAFAGISNATAFNFTCAANTITGTDGVDSPIGTAGDDVIYGLGGDDVIQMFNYLTADDSIDGGDGNDIITLQGDSYTNLTLKPGTIKNIERIGFGNGYSYNLTLAEGNVAAGATLAFGDNAKKAGYTVVVDGSAIVAGSLSFTAGRSACTYIGGAGDDTFHINNRFLSAATKIDGRGGNNTLVIDMADNGTLTLTGTQIKNIQSVWTLYPNSSYRIVTADDFIASGQVLPVHVTGLLNYNPFVWDGSAESDGTFHFYIESGCGTVTGSAGSDVFEANTFHQYGDDGVYTLNGGGGDDTFLMGSYANSSDTVDGGIGTDTVEFAGKLADYTLTKIATDTYTITGANLSDTLLNVEKIKFDDQTVLLGADITPPTLSSTSPADNATNVAPSANLVLTFSEAVKAGTGNIVIHRADGTALDTIAIGDATQVTISGTTLTVNPAADLPDGAGYYVTIDSGAITDLAGNAFTGITSTTAFAFTTADITPPTLSSTSPADDASSVAPSANLVLTFSEAVKAGTGNIIIHRADGTALDTIAIGDATQVTISGTTLTVNPAADLPDGASYYVTIDSGAITDLAGNAYAGITSTTAFNFTTTVTSKAPADFDGTGSSDILWQNDSGQPAIWLMNGANVLAGSGYVGSYTGTDWKVIGSGDFDADGKADILWQNQTTGQAAIWFMNGTSVLAGSGYAGNAPGTAWKVIGTGDFDGDGHSDILWQNQTTGQAAVWFMNGTSVLAGSGYAGNEPSAGWKVISAGDFDGDGKADILWQNQTTGQAAIWFMNGTSVLAGSGYAGNEPSAGWKVVGTGDFDGDGKSDILWQNTTTGQAAIWLLNGTNVLSGSGYVGNAPGTDWQIIGAEDLNGDGKSDILWQNTNGQAAVWLMSGTSVLSGSGYVGNNPGTPWHIVAGTGG